MSVFTAEKILSMLIPKEISYDEKYDELFVENNLNIFNHAFNVRNVYYTLFPLTKLYRQKYQYRKQFEQFLLNDSDIKYIAEKYIDKNEFFEIVDTKSLKERNESEYLYIDFPSGITVKAKIINKIVKQDYDYNSLTQDNDRRHFDVNLLVYYGETGWNYKIFEDKARMGNILNKLCYVDDKYFNKYFHNLDKKDIANIIFGRHEKIDNFATIVNKNNNLQSYFVDIIKRLKLDINKYIDLNYFENCDRSIIKQLFQHYMQYFDYHKLIYNNKANALEILQYLSLKDVDSNHFA